MTAELHDRAPAAPDIETGSARPRLRFGLSLRLLVLTIVFVMLAEVLIYVPSDRQLSGATWLNDRIAAAQIAALVLDAAPAGRCRPTSSAAGDAGRRAQTSPSASAARAACWPSPTCRRWSIADIDLRSATALGLDRRRLRDAAVAAATASVRVIGPGMSGVEFVEIVLDEKPLHEAMLRYSINILLISLLISGITAVLVYAALHWMIVRPVRRLDLQYRGLRGDPENPQPHRQALRPPDEIGEAERGARRACRTTLADELRQKKHLAALGLAVSKINHDLRNMLAAAQLFSDRLSDSSRPHGPALRAQADRRARPRHRLLPVDARLWPRRRARARAAGGAPLRRGRGPAGVLGLWDGDPVQFVNDVPPS